MILRIDDFGASSKWFERHRLKPFPYRETNAKELERLLNWCQRTHSSCTLAITALWVHRNGDASKYQYRFPAQTEVIRWGVHVGVFEVASHGLTHCIPGRHADWKWWRGNRQWHREFIPALPYDKQRDHLHRSKVILEEAFRCEVTTLVPPGNAISGPMMYTATELGYETITCALRSSGEKDRCSWLHGDCEDVVLHDWQLQGSRGERVLADLEPRAPFTSVREGVRIAR